MIKSFRGFALATLSVVILSACGVKDNNQAANTNGISIIAGSEIQNIEPLIKKASDDLGFPISVKYSGTIEGVEAVKTSSDYDVAWFGNSKYFYDTPESAKKIKLSEKIMLSPVIVGVKPESFSKNDLDEKKNYSWSDISSWVTTKKMTYGMSDPSLSNTGYVALMGVVYSTTNKGENISVSDVKKETLQNFFAGQKVTGKSSNWIMDQFNQSNIDFVINYESVILNNPSKLVAVYPQEGIVTADYQMILVNNDKEKIERYKKLTEYFKKTDIQSQLVNTYKYRSVNGDVMAKQKVFDDSKLLVEMPFNPSVDVSEAILDAYFNTYKKPAKFAFVVDTSGSMGGDRETSLKSVVNNLLTGQVSKYANIRDREEVIVIPFNERPYDAAKFDNKHVTQLNQYVQGLRMDGGTAMFDSVSAAMIELAKDKQVNGDKYRYSVIVFTDGASNQGSNSQEFQSWYQQQGFEKGSIRVFAISFGDADMNQLNQLTSITGGAVFDGKSSLAKAFRDIRSYQ